MLAIVPSATVPGVEGRPVTVEVHVPSGLPSFTIVGLPDTAAGRHATGCGPPVLGPAVAMRRITVNLAPSGLRGGSGSTSPSPSPCLIAEEEVEPAASRAPALGEPGPTGRCGRCRAWSRWSRRCRTTTAVVPAAAAGEACLSPVTRCGRCATWARSCPC